MTEYVEPAAEALTFWTKLTYNVGEVKGSLSNFYDMNGYIISGVLLVGGYTIAKHLLSNTYSFYKTFIRPARNLYKRYHGGSVVITGATDGLGLEYANQFAAMGFSLVLIARNQGKCSAAKSHFCRETGPSEAGTDGQIQNH